MSDEQDRDVEHWLRQRAQQFEAHHAPHDLVAGLLTAADTIVALRTEVTKWVNHAKTAIWSDSEECKLLTADNTTLRAEVERLRAALWDVHAICNNYPHFFWWPIHRIRRFVRAALGERT